MSTIEDIAVKGVNFPACPAILSELSTELQKPAVNAKRVTKLIKQDVALAAIVIKSANSPLIAANRCIDSISDAIPLLGFGQISNLVRQALLKNSGTTPTGFERFWDTSRYTAQAASRIAVTTHRVSPDSAYTFGLFHDCGIPLLAQRYPEYKDVLRVANEDSQRIFTDIEEEAIGTNHAILGYYLARSWGLPDAITHGILNHHDYAQLFNSPSGVNVSHTLIAINVMAEWVARTHLRSVHDCEWSKAREAVAYCLGRLPSDVDDLADDIIYQFDEAMNHGEA